MNHCRTCEHWSLAYNPLGYSWLNTCEQIISEADDQALAYIDTNDDPTGVSLITHADFGCVHWEERTANRKAPSEVFLIAKPIIKDYEPKAFEAWNKFRDTQLCDRVSDEPDVPDLHCPFCETKVFPIEDMPRYESVWQLAIISHVEKCEKAYVR